MVRDTSKSSKMSELNEDPKEETIKCVVVGDNNTGKTRLICARAYKETAPNYRCLKNAHHVPTVWAIDQYRNNIEVLEKARCNIDGVAVSLRLWDTFGDHHKNRKYALGKADVVLICFSVCDRNSLRNILLFWEQEVRRHCRNVPIIIVACKIDLRFTNMVDSYKKQGIITRSVKPSDIVYPEEVSLMAKQLNCHHLYETSVFLGHGVTDVFENACRIALLHRRSVSVWSNSALKKVKRPRIQEPKIPPKPKLAPVKKCSTVNSDNLWQIYKTESLCDVTFICQNSEYIRAHRVILASESNFFLQLFKQNSPQSELPQPQNSPHLKLLNEDWRNPVYLVPYDVTTQQMREVVKSCYQSDYPDDTENREFPEIMKVFGIFEEGNSSQEIQEERKRRIREEIMTSHSVFSDVTFQVDDGEVMTSKAMMSANCDVMNAMFTGSFIESSCDQVNLPGTNCATLQKLIEFLLLGEVKINPSEANPTFVQDLLSLANRFCLPKLVNIVELEVISIYEVIQRNNSNEVNFLIDVATLLQVSKFYSSINLYNWCLHYLTVHYNQACWNVPKIIKALPLSVQNHLKENRWPPVWYIKQKDVYDRNKISEK